MERDGKRAKWEKREFFNEINVNVIEMEKMCII